MSYGIWCTVFGGVTGHRENWLHQSGDLFETESLSYAERMAADLNEQMNKSPSRAATFRYKVVPFTPLWNECGTKVG